MDVTCTLKIGWGVELAAMVRSVAQADFELGAPDASCLDLVAVVWRPWNREAVVADPVTGSQVGGRRCGGRRGPRDRRGQLTRYSTPLTGSYYFVPSAEDILSFATSAE